MEKIIKERYYIPREIAEMMLFPWTTQEKTVRNFLANMVENGNKSKYSIVVKRPLDSVVDTAKHGIRYFIQGEGIIKIQEEFKKGELFNG